MLQEYEDPSAWEKFTAVPMLVVGIVKRRIDNSEQKSITETKLNLEKTFAGVNIDPVASY